MPTVGDHGLEVLRKAARDIGAKPLTDYALQVWLLNGGSESNVALAPTIQNISISTKDTEVEIAIPVNTKKFMIRARKISRLKLAFVAGESDTNFVTIPLGGAWIEANQITATSIFIQSSIDNNEIEFLTYI